MAATTIAWTEHSINPIRARKGSAVGHYCQKISPGCANCYASALQKRFKMPEFKGAGTDYMSANIFLDDTKLFEVMRRGKPTKYFWCDMSDIFGDWVTDEWLDKMFAVMALTPQHTHQVLTKRPKRMAEYFRTSSPNDGYKRILDEECVERVGQESGWAKARSIITTCSFLERDMPVKNPIPSRWPLPNVWLGVSVENQPTADDRIPLLLKCPSAVRFISAEPLLAPITLPTSMIDWCIVGGESGKGARECHVEWIRSLVKQCNKADVACFVKQLGANVCTDGIQEAGNWWPRQTGMFDTGKGYFRKHLVSFSHGGDPSEWPPDLRVREFP